MKKQIQDFKVLRNRRLTPDYFILELKSFEELPEMAPGQFVQVLVENTSNVFLRRPFSVHDVDYAENTLYLLIKRVGSGTRQLCYLEEGDFVNLVFPLGNSFTINENAGSVLLVGGGCGVAPLMYLARNYFSTDTVTNILIGGRSAEDIVELEKYEKFGNVFVTTEDGSLGEKGLVTDHSFFNRKVNFPDLIYTCGPESMMKAVAKYAADKNIECEVSLENLMACGIGACLCCIVDTRSGNKCTCTEGPVFNIKQLKWI